MFLRVLCRFVVITTWYSGRFQCGGWPADECLDYPRRPLDEGGNFRALAVGRHSAHQREHTSSRSSIQYCEPARCFPIQCAAVPTVTLGEIVDLVEGQTSLDRALEIGRVRPLDTAGPGDLSFLGHPRYAAQARESQASAILVSGDSTDEKAIRVKNTYVALARVLSRWFSEIPHPPRGMSRFASVDQSATISDSCAIADFVRIGRNVTIGERVMIHEGVTIGDDCRIGDETVLFPRVTLYHGTTVGSRCILHAGVVLGADGFGFASEDGVHLKIPQIGTVIIEDDVEIGAGSTIDRAALGETRIGEGTKIDNLVQIGHNVTIGKACLIVAQTGIAGSVQIGNHCILAGRSGVVGHVRVTDQVIIAAEALVTKDITEAGTYAGNPARPIQEHMRVRALTFRLPEITRRIDQLERASGVSGRRTPRTSE